MKRSKEKSNFIALFVLIVFFISAVMFFLGFLTGKKHEQKALQAAPVLKKEVLKEKEPVKSKKTEKTPSKEPAEEFTFYKTLNEKEKPFKQEKKRLKNKIVQKQKKNGFTIQIGSFKKESEARSFESKLIKKGFDAYVIMLNASENDIWYRVRIGSFKNREDAIQVIEKIEKNEGMKAFVTENIR